jgi:hypothetical protein
VNELLDSERQLLVELCGKKLRTLTSRELSGKYHWRKDRSQWREAFVLALQAAERADEERRSEGPMYRIRAAQALLELDEVERAVPLLEDSIARDWATDPVLRQNDHFLHSAYASLFELNFSVAPARARALFWKANEVFGAPRGFPWVLPVQDTLRRKLARAKGWDQERERLAELMG